MFVICGANHFKFHQCIKIVKTLNHAYFALPKYEDEFCNFVQFIQLI